MSEKNEGESNYMILHMRAVPKMQNRTLMNKWNQYKQAYEDYVNQLKLSKHHYTHEIAHSANYTIKLIWLRRK